jgi:hypothetical protein
MLRRKQHEARGELNTRTENVSHNLRLPVRRSENNTEADLGELLCDDVFCMEGAKFG